MTRKFFSRVVCEHCGRPTTAESEFERWVRNHPDLDSVRHSVVRFDLDVLIHRYRVVVDRKSSRTIQCMMFIETKTHGAKPTESQRDTLYLLDQVLRNRRPNIHSRPRRQIDHRPSRAYSLKSRREISLFLFGGHLLQMQGTSPENSDWMRWDSRHDITAGDLVRLLRFELNPDNPTRPLDIRRRSAPFASMPTLFDLFGDHGRGSEAP